MGSNAQKDAWSAITNAPLDGLLTLKENDDSWSTWAYSVCLMSLGDYRATQAALQLLERNLGTSKPSEVSEVRGLAAATLASGLRQIGEHEQAVAHDELACLGPGSAQVDGLIGLAADCVGRGQASEAAATLTKVAQLLNGWRDQVRYHWVRSEVALLTEDAATAIYHANQAKSEAARSPRHLAKSLLFLGVARDMSKTADGDDQLLEAVDLAQTLQLRPILWPAVRVLGDRATAAQQAAATDALSFISQRLPPGLGSHWEGRHVAGH